MPTTYTGTPEERMRRLESRGQRCDGNNRRCIQTAVLALHLIEIDPATGESLDGAEPVLQRACSKHRRMLTGRANWLVLDAQAIPPREARPKDQQAALAMTARMRQLTGRTFIPADGGPARTVTGARFVVDDYRLTDEHGEHHQLAEVKIIEPAVAPVLFSDGPA